MNLLLSFFVILLVTLPFLDANVSSTNNNSENEESLAGEIKNMLHELRKNLTEENSVIKKEIQKLKEQTTKEKQSQQNELESLNENLKKEISSMKEENEKLEKQLMEDNLSLMEENKQLKVQIAELMICKDDTKNIWEAVEKGSLLGVKYWLNQDPKNVNKKNKNFRDETPLMYACARGSLEIVKYLISQGAEINDTSKYGNTSLIIASYAGYMPIVKYLLDKEVNINQQDTKNKFTALHWAINNDQLDIVKILIENGADINLKDNKDRTSIAYAKALNRLSIERYLSSI